MPVSTRNEEDYRFFVKVKHYQIDYEEKLLLILSEELGGIREEQELAQLIDKKNALYLQIFRWKQKYISFVWIKLSCLCADSSTGFARVSQMVN